MSKKQPNLYRAWQRSLWSVYDHFGLFVVLSILWLFSAATLLLLPAATAAFFFIAKKVTTNETIIIKDFFKAITNYFLKSTILSFLYISLLLFLILNIRFYLSQFGFLGLIFACFTFWMIIVLVLMSIYTFPLLLLNKNLTQTVKYSFLLTCNHLSFTLKLCITACFLSISVVCLPIIGIAALTIFIQNAFLELQSLYQNNIKITAQKRSLRELWRPWEFD